LKSQSSTQQPTVSERTSTTSGATTTGGGYTNGGTVAKPSRPQEVLVITYDTSMVNAAFDAQGRLQNNDWGHFVDFIEP
jgi:hypothetical protein